MNLRELCNIADYVCKDGILFNDDCFEIIKMIDDKSIDLILTDPPYLFNRGGGKTAGTEGKSKIANSDLYRFDGKTMGEMGNFDKPKIYKLLDESKRVCKVMRGYYFCNETALQYYLSWATENKCKYNIITLEKPPSIINRNRYSTNSEFLVRIVANSGAGIKILDYTQEENKTEWLYSVQKFNKIKGKKHPSEKPIEVVEGVINLNTNEGDVVLDLFTGSGAILNVCKKLNRKFIGCELDEKYFNVSLNQIKGGD